MSWRETTIPILIAIALSVATLLLLNWRFQSNGLVVQTTKLTEKSVFVEHDYPWLRVVKIPPIKDTMFATWYNYSLKDDPGYSLTHATAASRTYPRETQLLVCTTKCVQVRVNDYGPEEWTGKDIDLSSYAFSKIAPLSLGVIKVSVTKL